MVVHQLESFFVTVALSFHSNTFSDIIQSLYLERCSNTQKLTLKVMKTNLKLYITINIAILHLDFEQNKLS